MLNRPETLALLRGAHDEIVMLRRQMGELAPKAHAYETIAILARQSVNPEQSGCGVDMAWRLRGAVEQLEKEREEEREEERGQTQALDE
jgi:hypothetical protein